MNALWQSITEWSASAGVAVGRALVIAVVGLVIARVVGATLRRFLAPRASAQQQMIVRRTAVYAIVGLTAIASLRELGFDLGVLVGAAGILTVAVGFASKTAASNVISGMFLMGEKPFVLGDVITVGGTTGEVISVDLLSVKLRTFDNLLVRIPNESLLANQVINVSYFPIRRYDMRLRVGYGQDIAATREVLLAVAGANPLCLQSPAPVCILDGFSDSGTEIQFSVWAARETFLDLRISMVEQTQLALVEAGIDISPPQRKIIMQPGS